MARCQWWGIPLFLPLRLETCPPPVPTLSSASIFIDKVPLVPTDSLHTVDRITEGFLNSSRKTLLFVPPTIQNGEIVICPSLEMIQNVQDVTSTASGFFFFQFKTVVAMEEVIRGGLAISGTTYCTTTMGVGHGIAKTQIYTGPGVETNCYIGPYGGRGEVPCRVDIEYEWLPLKCNACHSLGHRTSDCPSTVTTTKQPVTVYVQRRKERSGAALGMKPKASTRSPMMEQPSNSIPQQPNALDDPQPAAGSHMVTESNAKGLNRHDHQVAVTDLVGEFRLHFIGLLETRASPVNYVRIQNKVLSRWSWFSDSSGPGNRIWIAWDSDFIDVDVLNLGTQFVHCQVFIKQLQEHVLVTVAYGANDTISRRELWHSLDSLAEQIYSPWLVCGDFNAVLDNSEICGTAGDGRQAMEEF
ncbi:UNVERIFIED_CONTAM: hypothetical protein Slati_0874300 [Sesamum latifolium]|uniref:Endonuclease/exonuclease/phosphatase domain-containing protein n=1 Tax=Sesamum latifolium TaxID=2727402 RepID=A0AAW2XSS6_9LAMI